jgi:hypothetical protein
MSNHPTGFDDNQEHGADHGDDHIADQHGRRGGRHEQAYFANRPRLRKPACFDQHDRPKIFQRWKNDWQLHREQIALMGYTAAQQEHEIKVEFCFALSENTLNWMEVQSASWIRTLDCRVGDLKSTSVLSPQSNKVFL